MLNFRSAYQLRGIPKAIYAALIGGKAIGLGLQKALADMVIIGCAKKVLRTRGFAACGDMCTACVLNFACFTRPFVKPRGIVTGFAFETQSDAVNFVDFSASPRRGIQPDQHTVRPAVVFREIHE